MKKNSIILIIVTAFLLFATAPVYALQYSISDLGSFKSPDFGFLGGSPLVSYKINNKNQIIGHSSEGAFLWENGDTVNLGNVNIGGINDNGVLAGNDSEGIFVWENGVKTYIPGENEYYDQDYSQVSDINNANQISGTERINGMANNYAYLWDDATRTAVRIGTYSPYDYLWGMATSVNDAGHMTGIVDGDTPFLWKNGVLTEMTNFGWTSDINNADQIAGSFETAEGLYHAALWEDSLITDMGTVDGYTSSTAWAINELGQAVGSSSNSHIFEGGSAFYWDNKTGMINLNDYISPESGWDLIWASDINDYGYIVGVGTYNGETRGFLATPTPEPATMILLGTGLIGLAGARRKMRKNPAA
ncbi:MAG: PEP-CTERM sorting domain-containing protein [Desulfococcaceae bacterium]|jgi:probable HAF family extracellular repeat protein|nr:PEP-CTERM sorting domain-containing protein [Desulfococcaceae bacterium]